MFAHDYGNTMLMQLVPRSLCVVAQLTESGLSCRVGINKPRNFVVDNGP